MKRQSFIKRAMAAVRPTEILNPLERAQRSADEEREIDEAIAAFEKARAVYLRRKMMHVVE